MSDRGRKKRSLYHEAITASYVRVWYCLSHASENALVGNENTSTVSVLIAESIVKAVSARCFFCIGQQHFPYRHR